MDGKGEKMWCTKMLTNKILSRSKTTVEKKEKEKKG